MGLDQYAYARKNDEEIEIAYWRKHPNLQGWMEGLYLEKGGTETFNCVDVELTLENLCQLEDCLNDEDLPETTGFFFGADSDKFYERKDREFITAARNYIESGYKIFYYSWW